MEQHAEVATPLVRLRRFVGGAGTSWLVLEVGCALSGVLDGAAMEMVASFGSLGGIAIMVLAPVAALLVLGLGRVRGAALTVSAAAGAAGGMGLVLVFGVFILPLCLISGCLGAASGLAGWFGSRRAGRSMAWTATPLLAAGGLFGGPALDGLSRPSDAATCARVLRAAYGPTSKRRRADDDPRRRRP